MSPSKKERVVIVGASDKPDRYAFKAMHALLKQGHEVVLVHPSLKAIEGHPVHQDLSEIIGHVDTVTLYVGPNISSGLSEKLISLRPRRVLFNPGTENPSLAANLAAEGIIAEEVCTLVLLATGSFVF